MNILCGNCLQTFTVTELHSLIKVTIGVHKQLQVWLEDKVIDEGQQTLQDYGIKTEDTLTVAIKVYFENNYYKYNIMLDLL